ncbi:uncharacterized protein RSE6_11472 [Rhynchosporium secalis]|uniref:Chromo domain-containing protein n=1 Tax=Rhynchosporium secalis TaxID=38038 RepID=A0A1E1MN14_RHYSE|nr:uncharacterized protein RSE6_11472 [Rhynchosporium secalis]
MAKNQTEDIDEAEEDRMLRLQLQPDSDSEDTAGKNVKQGPKKENSTAGANKTPGHKKRKSDARDHLSPEQKKKKTNAAENMNPEPIKGKAKTGGVKKPEPKKMNAEAAENKNQELKKAKDKGHTQWTPETDIPEDSGVPARIRAERKAAYQVQLLVQWKNYPEEKDWTWELESELKQSTPHIVNAWKTKRGSQTTDSEGMIEHTVEKILSKKMYKGVVHYLVKWEGYEKVEDRTWEPCDRLKIDIPEIVEEYESKGKGNKKSKK